MRIYTLDWRCGAELQVFGMTKEGKKIEKTITGFHFRFWVALPTPRK